jgi:hypothetical protein
MGYLFLNGMAQEDLVHFFAKTRDDLIAEDTAAWIALNEIYPCVKHCLGGIAPKKLDYSIITTKQERFVRAILEANQITPPQPDMIFDLENPFGPKVKVGKLNLPSDRPVISYAQIRSDQLSSSHCISSSLTDMEQHATGDYNVLVLLQSSLGLDIDSTTSRIFNMCNFLC